MVDSISITGLGLITPYGIGKQCFCININAQKKPSTTLYLRQNNQSIEVAKIPNEVYEQEINIPDFHSFPRSTKLVLLSSSSAWEDADLQTHPYENQRIGLYIGTAYGLIQEIECYEDDLKQRNLQAAHPSIYQEVTLGTLAGHISIQHHIQGPIIPFAHGWSSSLDAIEFAITGLQKNEIDLAVVSLVETVESSYLEDYVQTAQSMKVSVNSVKSNELILGEGAITLILERTEDARKRGGQIYCEQNLIAVWLENSMLNCPSLTELIGYSGSCLGGFNLVAKALAIKTELNADQMPEKALSRLVLK